MPFVTHLCLGLCDGFQVLHEFLAQQVLADLDVAFAYKFRDRSIYKKCLGFDPLGVDICGLKTYLCVAKGECTSNRTTNSGASRLSNSPPLVLSAGLGDTQYL